MKGQLNCTVVGVEIDEAAAKQGEEYCERVIVGDIEQIDLQHELGEERFDVILSADVLEHLRDPWEILRKLQRYLTSNGKVIISLPNAGFHGLLGELCCGKFSYREKGILDGTHLRFFTRRELELLVLSAGLVPLVWDEAQLGAEHSEFADSWTNLPAELQIQLRGIKDGLAYQIIVSASPINKANWEKYLSAQEESLRDLKDRLTARDLNIAELTRQLAESDTRESELSEQFEDCKIELTHLHDIIFHSISWRLTKPLRWASRKVLRFFRRFSTTYRFIAHLVQHPDQFQQIATRLRDYRRAGGLIAVKQAMVNIPKEISHEDVWKTYCKKQKPLIKKYFKDRLGGMNDVPLISILLPTYKTPINLLRETIDSVISQHYPSWELCVVDDGSDDVQLRELLELYAQRDSRIRVSFAAQNGGIAAASNRALAMAKGDFVVLLDHDDRLEEQALFRVAESIIADFPDMIYSDEALLSGDGKEVTQFVFRPAFSLELLRAHPYIVHLVAFRTALLREIGGFDETLSISQDYDIILRMAEKASTIVHIPEVLYLWRQQTDSAGHAKQDQVMEASTRLLTAHLSRCGEKAQVQPGKIFNFFDVRYPLQAELRVAIIIPTKNHGDLVRQCVESIKRTVHQVNYDIIVIDHESTDATSLDYFSHIAKQHRVLRYAGRFNFSAINNWAVAQLDDVYSHYLFCNNDIEAIKDGWLERMLELGQKQDVAIVGATLLYPDGHTYQHAGVCVGMMGAAEHFAKFMDTHLLDGRFHPGYNGSLIANHELSAVTAACLLMRREVFAEIGGYDEMLAVGFGDVDLCLRTRQAGYRVIQCSHAVLVHHESYTRGKTHGGDPHPKDSALFMRRWQKFIAQGDPYFNPNLSIHDTRWDTLKPMPFVPIIKRRIYHPSKFKRIPDVTVGHGNCSI